MKNNLVLFICTAICFIVLAGCGLYNDGNSAAETEKTVTKNPLNHAAGATWEPTPYATVNNFDGVIMAVKEGTASSAGLTVTYENNSSSRCIYGEYFGLEKIIDGKWYQVPVVIEGDYGFNDIGYELASGEDREWAVNWEWLYGSLDPGEYRIVKDIHDFSGSGDFDTYHLVAEFTI